MIFQSLVMILPRFFDFGAMNMMNKCAKFHKDSPSGKKVKFKLAKAIELSETAVFVYNFV